MVIFAVRRWRLLFAKINAITAREYWVFQQLASLGKAQ